MMCISRFRCEHIRLEKNVQDGSRAARIRPGIICLNLGMAVMTKCCKRWQLAASKPLTQVRQEGCLRLDLLADLKGNAEKLIGSRCLCAVRALKWVWDVVTSWRRRVPQNRLCRFNAP